MKIFTHTTGRTGTMWLAQLFNLNTDWECHHERLGWMDYGLSTPDIRQMRGYNEAGPQAVEAFWKLKAESLPKNYVETTHTLCKAGLNAFRDLLGDHKIIHLYRPCEEVVASMAKRGDYLGHGNHWLWYLDPAYPRNLVDFTPFEKYGQLGLCAWYWHEMEARCPKDVISVRVKDLNDPDRAGEFLAECGVYVDHPVIPPRANESRLCEIDPEAMKIIQEVSNVSTN